MRFIVTLELKNENLPIEYRQVMISLFKNLLTTYEGGKYFEDYYHGNKVKPFTFAVNLPKAIFEKEKIFIPQKTMKLLFSTSDNQVGITFFNAFLSNKDKTFPLFFQNTMIIKNIRLEQEECITAEKVNIIMKSPLCIRKHEKEGNIDRYYSLADPKFAENLREVIKRQIEDTKVSGVYLNDFSIQAIQAKKTVIKHKKIFIESSIGTFQLTGNCALLNYLYRAGMGSRRSSGFGCFEIL